MTFDGGSARTAGKRPDRLRPVQITRSYLMHAEGSVLIQMGNTKIICSVSLEDRVPPFLYNTGKGWLTSEYGMLPRATKTRNSRESISGRVRGRTFEIQRLIGRSLRSIIDLNQIGERTIDIDCDVIQADGGTRTAAITGAYVALKEAIWAMLEQEIIEKDPTTDSVAAVSVGIVGGVPALDLCYEEDSSAQVDMNVVMTGSGKFVEVQGTAEGGTFSEDQMNKMIALARKGIEELTQIQREALGLLARD